MGHVPPDTVAPVILWRALPYHVIWGLYIPKWGLMGLFFRCAAVMELASLSESDSMVTGRFWLRIAGVVRTKVGRTAANQRLIITEKGMNDHWGYVFAQDEMEALSMAARSRLGSGEDKVSRLPNPAITFPSLWLVTLKPENEYVVSINNWVKDFFRQDCDSDWRRWRGRVIRMNDAFFADNVLEQPMGDVLIAFRDDWFTDTFHASTTILLEVGICY